MYDQKWFLIRSAVPFGIGSALRSCCFIHLFSTSRFDFMNMKLRKCYIIEKKRVKLPSILPDVFLPISTVTQSKSLDSVNEVPISICVPNTLPTFINISNMRTSLLLQCHKNTWHCLSRVLFMQKNLQPNSFSQYFQSQRTRLASFQMNHLNRHV